MNTAPMSSAAPLRGRTALIAVRGPPDQGARIALATRAHLGLVEAGSG